MTILAALDTAVQPWAHFYSHSKALSTGVTFLHVGSLMYGGGRAITADCRTLDLGRPGRAGHRRRLHELSDAHRPVLLGLSVTLTSGALMWAADFQSLTESPVFWIKMGLIVLLIANGVLLRRVESRLHGGSIEPGLGWRRLRRAAAASLALWFGSALLGTALLSA